MRFFISAGEPSGDLHGSNLIRELRQLRSDATYCGFGGPKMSATGCGLIADMTDLAIMGFARVLPHVATFWKLLQQADKVFQETRPDAVVLIDYPGFNWWVAKKAKQHGIPVFYYGTPQIWAWATHRVRKLKRLVDYSMCKLPFEPDWYAQHGCEATFVGHPYFDEFLNHDLDTDFIHELGSAPFVAVLPGSRRHEVENNLHAFLKTIDLVHQSVPQARFAIASYNEKQAELARSIIATRQGLVEPSVYVDRTREIMNHATCALACSGSVSLELLHEQTPTVIHYKIDRFGNFLQKRFRRCKFITLVNLLASEHRFESDADYDPNLVQHMDEAPFPEYLTMHDRASEMAHHLVRWLVDEELRQAAIKTLQPIREGFVKPGASRNAARFIAEKLGFLPRKVSMDPKTCLPANTKVA